MINEARRRAYLDAMQVANWLPRTELPFAAPSRPELLLPVAVEAEREIAVAPVAEVPVAAPVAERAAAAPAVEQPQAPRPRIAMPEPKQPEPVAAAAQEQAGEAAKPIEPPPRFSLQLMRAGNVLLVVELPTGDSFQSRDPAYILLKDLLRAARLPDKPQQVGDGEPIRWPLLNKGSLDQGAEAARDYVQGVMAAELENMGCDCIWLIGRPALRFAGEVDVDACYRELAVEGLGRALAMPGLEQLMEQPAAKAELWKTLRRSMPRWHIGSSPDE